MVNSYMANLNKHLSYRNVSCPLNLISSFLLQTAGTGETMANVYGNLHPCLRQAHKCDGCKTVSWDLKTLLS